MSKSIVAVYKVENKMLSCNNLPELSLYVIFHGEISTYDMHGNELQFIAMSDAQIIILMYLIIIYFIIIIVKQL